MKPQETKFTSGVGDLSGGFSSGSAIYKRSAEGVLEKYLDTQEMLFFFV